MPVLPSLTPFEQFKRQIAPTTVFNYLFNFVPSLDSIYLYGSSDESRASHLADYLVTLGVRTAFLVDADPQADYQISFLIESGAYSDTISLYNNAQQDELWDKLQAPVVYLDITGLPHHIWAPLISSAHRQEQKLHVMYVEPAEYRRANNAEKQYDLSDDIQGIKALPGFASFHQTTGKDFCYVPILGFEGVRFSYVTNTVEPPANKTFPIIGLPGFRPEYPFETYASNQRPLELDGQLLLDLKYVDASCPFSLFYALENITNDNSGEALKIALLGTKPHALGAILYALYKDSISIQLIYDFPKRKSGRTLGIGWIYVYHVSFFLEMLASSL